MGVRRRVAGCLGSTARTPGVLCAVGRSILFHIGGGFSSLLRRGVHEVPAISARVRTLRAPQQYSRSVCGT
jgi:hypothetical protein